MAIKNYLKKLFSEPNFTDLILAMVGIIALFVTFKQATIAKRQFEELRVSNEQNAKSIGIAERTRIDAEEERHAWIALGINDVPELNVHGDTHLVVLLRNDGHTPAKDIKLHAYAVTGYKFRDDAERDQRIDNAGWKDYTRSEFMKETYIAPIVAGESIEYTLRAAFPITKSQRKIIREGSQGIACVHLLVDYKDTYGHPHTTESLFQITWLGKVWIFQATRFHSRLD